MGQPISKATSTPSTPSAATPSRPTTQQALIRNEGVALAKQYTVLLNKISALTKLDPNAANHFDGIRELNKNEQKKLIGQYIEHIEAKPQLTNQEAEIKFLWLPNIKKNLVKIETLE
ncbi:MAG: hypothetical protein ACJARD_000289 [Alphaproteobacteria bacterium]|jgi:hypothetical protein